MSIRTTLRLLFAVCLLGFIIGIIETRDRRRVNPVADQQALLHLDAGDVEKIVIARKDLAVECIRKDGVWFLSLPLRAKADNTKINRILGVLESLRQYEIVTQKEMNERELTLADYGLKDPEASILVQGQQTSHNVMIGNKIELGDRMCIRLNGSNDVIITSADIMDVIPEKVDDLRDRTVFRGEPEQLARFQIKRPGSFIEIVSRDKGWFISQPLDVPADERKVRAIISGLLKCRIVRFIRDSGSVDGGKEVDSDVVSTRESTMLAPYGLGQDEAASIVSVWFAGDDVGHDIVIGKASAEVAGEVYARFSEIESVFTVPSEFSELLGVTVDDLRSRSILPHPRSDICGLALEANERKVVLARETAAGWNIVEPVRAKGDNDVIERLLDQVAAMRISAFTDTNKIAVSLLPAVKPRLVLRTSTNVIHTADKVAADASTNAAAAGMAAEANAWYPIFIGENVPGSDVAYIQCATNPSLLEVDASALATIMADPCNPLAYMDRQILSLEPSDVIKLSLTRRGQVQSVERNVAGNWIVCGASATNDNSGTDYVVNSKVIDDVLLALTNIRATRIESTEPSNPSAYGFDTSETRLSAVVKGDKALQKTLIFGFKSGTDGIYTMLRGTDVLFVLDNLSVTVLTRSLVGQEQTPKAESPRP